MPPEFLRLRLGAQERLAAAQLVELSALANYNRALAAYGRAIGTGWAIEMRPDRPSAADAGDPER